MVKDSENVFEAALQLPVNTRAELAATLIESLEGTSADADVEASWSQETANRVRDLDEQKADTLSWTEVRKKILGNAAE